MILSRRARTTQSHEGHQSRARSASVRRVLAATLLVLVIAIGLAVHTFAPDGAVSDIAGDLLYAVAVYLFVVCLFPRLSTLVVATVAGAWCVAVECFQLTGLPEAWALIFRPIVLVLGTIFDPRDLLMYVIAVVLAAFADTGIRMIGRTRRSPEVP